MNKKLNTKRTILFLAAIVLIFVLATLGLIFNSRSEKVTPNPEGTIGNTAGNINNSGLFCEHDGKVYFSNSYDHGTLYSMDVNEANITKISPARVCNILAGGDYLYYFQLGESGTTGLGGVRAPHSFNRCHLDGTHATSLVREVIASGQLIGNTLYLLGTNNDGPYFFRIDTDKENRKELTKTIINPASAQGSTMYYNGTETNHFLYALDTHSDNSRVILEGNIWYPHAEGDWIYYIDLGNNYQLRRYSISQNTVEILSTEKVQGYNVGYGYIYYQTMGADAHLALMNTDGSNVNVIAGGQFCNINMTSQFVYFQDFMDQSVTYHAYLGSTSFSTFSAAIPIPGK